MKRILGLSTVGLVVVILLLLFLFGGLPAFGLHGYGWGPSGFLGVLLVILVVLIVLEKI